MKGACFVSAACIALAALVFVLFVFLLAGTLDTVSAKTQWINVTAITKLNVSDYLPRVVGVIFDDSTSSPADEIDLVSASTRSVFCNGTVIDLNGKDDIVAVNATIYWMGNKSSQHDDKNEHYSNHSCAVLRSGPMNKTFSCGFKMWYFANNGTWFCNMSAWDNATTNPGKKAGYNSSLDNAKVNPVFALNVPAVLNYGELSINQTSPADVMVNVTNTGNMNIDLKLNGYGGTNLVENNLSMKCALGNITIANERFSQTAAQAFSLMTALSGQHANPYYWNAFSLSQRKSELLNSSKGTYWKIRVPMGGVKGQCNGTVVFTSAPDI